MHFLLAFVLAVWVAAFIQMLVNLSVAPRLRRDQTPSRMPLVSVVIPARNEARVIERTVRAFLAQDYAAFEVIVVNDRSTDGTEEILRSIDDPRLLVVHGEEPPPGWLGKPWALEQAVRRAQGEIVLVVDADLIYAPQAIRAAVAELERSGAALIFLYPHLEMVRFAEHLAMPMMTFTGFVVAPVWYSNRSTAPRLALGGGSGNLVRRDALEAIGGFAALREAVVDDVALAQVVRSHGLVTRAVRADDLIRVRMYHSAGEIIDGFTKNLFPALGRSFPWSLLMLAWMIVSHLLPFALAITGDVLAVITVVMITIVRVVLFRSMRYRLDNALFLHPLMVLFWIYIFVRSIWYVGIRRQIRWRGRTYDAAETRFGAQQ